MYLKKRVWAQLHGERFFPHDVNAASDDESGSSAADSQVWSAGRHCDWSGDPADSTGTETTFTADLFR